jgi:hypothetical protein
MKKVGLNTKSKYKIFEIRIQSPLSSVKNLIRDLKLIKEHLNYATVKELCIVVLTDYVNNYKEIDKLRKYEEQGLT